MSTYNRVVAADETASLAPAIRARLATEMADPTSEVGASLSDTFVEHLGQSSGTDDTTTIQAALTSAGLVKGKAGENYRISSPLIIGSSTVLDMTGCTVTLNSGSNCNMVNNTAVSTVQRSVTDAAITTGATTLTSATAAFTSADVGRTVVITGAGPNAGMFALSAIVTVVTDATTVTVDSVAGATVSGAALSIYDRDRDIQIIGGTWDRGSNGGTGSVQHSIYLRRLDDLFIDLDKFTSSGTGPKYAVHPGDVNRFDLRVKHFDHVSDGVHVRGPATSGVIHNVAGHTGDDLVVLGATDSSRPTEGGGNISGVEVWDIRADNLATGCFKLYGNTGSTIKGVHINGVRGVGVNRGWLGATDITGMTMDDITVENVRSDASVVISINASAGAILLRNITAVSTASGSVVSVVQVGSGVTVGTLTLNGCDFPTIASTAAGAKVVELIGTVKVLRVTDVTLPTATSSALVHLAATASVSQLFAERCKITGGSGVIKAAFTGAVLTEAWVSDCHFTEVAYPLDLASTTTVHLNGVTNTVSAGGVILVRATGVVTLVGGDASLFKSGTPLLLAGYALRVNCPSFQVDLSKLTSKSNGDQAYNSNAALSCGAGLVVSNGTNWKNIYSGLTYP